MPLLRRRAQPRRGVLLALRRIAAGRGPSRRTRAAPVAAAWTTSSKKRPVKQGGRRAPRRRSFVQTVPRCRRGGLELRGVRAPPGRTGMLRAARASAVLLVARGLTAASPGAPPPPPPPHHPH